jgi:hypothetical protein
VYICASISGGTSGDRYRGYRDDFDSAVLEPFQDWANLVLPEPRVWHTLMHNAAGLPVFPDINLSKVTAEQVMDFLEEYLEDLWGTYMAKFC